MRKSTDSSALSGISSRRGDYFIKLFLIEKTEQKSGDCRWFPALPAFLIDNQFSLMKSLSVILLTFQGKKNIILTGIKIVLSILIDI